jgi:ComF family protein
MLSLVVPEEVAGAALPGHVGIGAIGHRVALLSQMDQRRKIRSPPTCQYPHPPFFDAQITGLARYAPRDTPGSRPDPVFGLLRGLLELWLPPACPACEGAPGAGPGGICRSCLGSLTPAPAALAPPRGLDALVAAAEFRIPVEGWIRRFKYPRPGLAGLDPKAEAIARALAREAGARAPGPRPDLVVPIPLHPRRLRERGFNPACELARAIARPARLRLGADALARLRDTPSQTGLERAARRRNVRGAFAARHAVPARIWLVDDVVTTGSTLAEAARALRRAGARRVVGVCAARTPL